MTRAERFATLLLGENHHLGSFEADTAPYDLEEVARALESLGCRVERIPLKPSILRIHCPDALGDAVDAGDGRATLE